MDLIGRHVSAMECRDCEDFLQLGIDAFNWMIRADEQFREAIFDGRIEYDAETDESLSLLFRTWLKPSSYAEKWAAEQTERGFTLEKIAQFRQCVTEVRAIVQNANSIGGEMAKIRDAAIASHRKGETIDWEDQ